MIIMNNMVILHILIIQIWKNNYYGNPMFNSINIAYEQIDDDEIFSYGIAQPNKIMQNNFEVKEKKKKFFE